MAKGKLAFTAAALGAAYLLRNEKSRARLKDQFRRLGTSSRNES